MTPGSLKHDVDHVPNDLLGFECGFLVLQKESKAKARGVLVAGLITAMASLAGVLGVQAVFKNLG